MSLRVRLWPDPEIGVDAIIANVVTSMRYVFGVLIVALFYVDTRAALLGIVALVCFSALSDLIDGPVARRTRQSSRPDGAPFDPLADDFFILSGLLCLVSADLVPLWFGALTLWLRASLVLVRMLVAVRRQPYAMPRTSTRASMAGLYIGEVFFFAGYAAGDWLPWLVDPTATDLVLGGMTALMCVAAFDFIVGAHRRSLVALFTPIHGRNGEQSLDRPGNQGTPPATTPRGKRGRAANSARAVSDSQPV